MRFRSLLFTLTLLATVCIPYVTAAPQRPFLHNGIRPETTQVLTVWFDAPPQLTISYPPAYLFNVAAKTAPGLWITNLHWDFGDGATLDVPFSAQNQVSDIRAHQYANSANYCVTVTAYDNAGNSASASEPLMPIHDFTLAATSPSQTVTPGASTSYTVSIGPSASACGSTVAVSLSISSPAPAGVSWNLNPTSGQTSFTSTLQVQTSSSTPNGTYTINVIGVSGNVTHVAAVTLFVTPPSFTLSAVPNSLFVPPEFDNQPPRTNTTSISVQSLNGFNSPVSLSAGGAPTGMTLNLSAPTVTPPPNGQTSATLTILTPCSTAPGTYVITVEGVAGGITKQVNVSVTVTSCVAAFNLFGFLLWGLVGAFILIPLLVILFFFFGRRRPVGFVPPPPPPPAVPVAVAVPQIVPCPICHQPLSLVDGQWFCATCHRHIYLTPD